MERFYMPTKVIIGENCVKENYKEFSKLGKRALIVTGKNSARLSGALDDIENSLQLAKVEYCIFDKIENNPSVDTVLEGGRAANKFGADFIVACGGGSPLDAGKAIAASFAGITRDELINCRFPAALPVAAIPTTAGTGSEVTHYSILTDNVIQNKRNVSREDLFPVIAFLDAKYTMSLGSDSTVNTAVDALSHAVEGFLTLRSTPFSDVLALEAMGIISKMLPLLKGRLTEEARKQLLYASMLSGVVIAQTGTTVLHAMGYHLTYHKNTDHGRANGILFGRFMKLLDERQVRKVDVALKAMGMESVQAFCDTITDLFDITEKITQKEAKDYSKIAFNAKSLMSTPGNLSEEDIEYIYLKSLQ